MALGKNRPKPCFDLGISMTGQPGPPGSRPPRRNKALLRPYEGKPMVNTPVIRPYFWGGYVRGGYVIKGL